MPRLKMDARDFGLGARLGGCREAAGMTQREVAERLDWDKSRLSRLEGGLRQIHVSDVAQLLAVYGVHGTLRDDLLAAARSNEQHTWWLYGAEGTPSKADLLGGYESTATRITDWAAMIVPGLLQTESFARAWLTAVRPTSNRIEEIIADRRRRQRILHGPVRYTAYLGESALRSPVGDPSIMVEQISALIAIQRRDNVSLRMVPIHVEPHEGQLGSFIALEFTDAAPIVMLEMAQASVFQNDPAHTAAYLGTITALNRVALGERESLLLLERLRARWADLVQRRAPVSTRAGSR